MKNKTGSGKKLSLEANFNSPACVKLHEGEFRARNFFHSALMWALGMISSYTFGGAIHLLLVFALIVLAIRLAQGRSVA